MADLQASLQVDLEVLLRVAGSPGGSSRLGAWNRVSLGFNRTCSGFGERGPNTLCAAASGFLKSILLFPKIGQDDERAEWYRLGAKCILLLQV